MGIDPLSSATRNAKRNLLVVSVLAITFKAFNVTIEKIPLGGLAINFDNRVFAFLLLLALIYFLPIFLIYYFIDIRNFSPTRHQQDVLGRYNERIGAIPSDFVGELLAKMNAAVGPELAVLPNRPWAEYLEKGLYSVMRDDYRIVHRAGSVGVDKAEKQYEDVNRVFDKMVRRYKRQRGIQRNWRALPRYGTELLYLVRNYVTDCALPAMLAFFAFGAVLDLYSVQWLQLLVPTTKNPTG